MSKCICLDLEYSVLENGKKEGYTHYYEVCVDRIIAAEYFAWEYRNLINDDNRYNIIIMIKNMFENDYLDDVFTNKENEHYEDVQNWLKKYFLEDANEKYKEINDDEDLKLYYQLTI